MTDQNTPSNPETVPSGPPQNETTGSSGLPQADPPRAGDTADQHDDPEDTGNAEAARYRRRLRDTEAERDQLQAQLDAQRRAVIDWRASTAVSGAVDPALLDAAGVNVAELLDDTGHLDMAAVDAFIETTAVKFRVHRDPQPNPQQGAASEARSTGLAEAFAPRNHR